MGPDQLPAKSSRNQARQQGTQSHRRPRTRLCLLKGCGKRFRPSRALARYCSAECAAKGREWSLWKAQQRYRETKQGKRKRQAQSRRYRERSPCKKRTRACCKDTARVITPDFFRLFLRSSRLLRPVLSQAPFPPPAVLLARVPARRRARPGPGTALAGAPKPQPRCATPSRSTYVRAAAEIVQTY
jgi:hypothetical protein